MLRIILTTLVLLLPTGLYFLWVGWRNRRRAPEEQPAEEKRRFMSWEILAGIGIGIGMVLAFAVITVLSRRGTDTVYVPPHMANGVVVPGAMVSREPAVPPVEEPPRRARVLLPW